eukprot:CAMPEP_0201490696 /NCGR_PEP_ID=MMETSP0151_2-20130828/27057_1 /ASSEMBLY_ACC=CAM_ASM_000257 /TAXON_ID=200890 /ORGANISM="Paramoeba atlantica, Strain 621/1 / CCAP 1560/9" /LENGTH=338 /DNA_ID=CAMNT_0047876745 /DNA_START=311 /DNA_END=1327 /DNA_ORIENTATION=+
MFQEYWYNNNINNVENVLPQFRSPYQTYDPYSPNIQDPSVPDGIHKVLVPLIQRVHALYRNVVTTDRYIVPGYGCSDLLTAVAYAKSELANSSMINIFAKPPYYTGYPNMASLFPGRMQFTTNTNLDPETVLEFNTHPNNPTGTYHSSVYPSSFVVYDSVYLWPSLTNITEPLDADVVLFSLSKSTGHAGSRFGWALVKDKTVADLMANYYNLAHLYISADVQYRAYSVLQNLVDHPYDLFDHISKGMEMRWQQTLSLLARQPDRFLQHSASGSFYMFIECLADGEKNACQELFLNAGMKGESGTAFGVGTNYVRLEMVQHQPVFEIFLDRLSNLTSS